jgi:hypothetical protein
MIHYSVLIPARNAIGDVARSLAQIGPVLSRLILPYEIICIDDASAPPAQRQLADLRRSHDALRWLRFDEPRGTSAALTAGIAAARGDLVIAVHPGRRWSDRIIPQLISRLSQHDLAFVEDAQPLATELLRPLAAVSRLLSTRAEPGPDERFLWVARREAVAGLTLARSAFRILPGLVARRGRRVCRVTLAEGLPPRGAAFVPRLWERLAARWLDRSFEPHLAREQAEMEMPAREPSGRLHAGRAWQPAWPTAVAAEEELSDAE